MKNTIIGLKELRENMDNYISQIGKGRSFVVVRKSKPVFRLEPLDEWGDEGVWEKVIDSTKIKKGGVPLREVLSSISKKEQKDIEKRYGKPKRTMSKNIKNNK